MSKDMITSRRRFLKSGAIVAAPLALVATPAVAALADDGGRARLLRIEEERSIESLNRSFLRRFNAGGHTGEFFADGRKPKLPCGVTAIKLDSAAEPRHFALSEDGSRASARFACTAEFEHALEGEGTFFQMARLQGNGPVRLSEARTLVAKYVKNRDGWVIERIELA
jgi:hypothetical protein